MHTITLTTQELDVVMAALQTAPMSWRLADPVLKKILAQVNDKQLPMPLNGGHDVRAATN